jgi:signal recognition particle subunit SRP54
MRTQQFNFEDYLDQLQQLKKMGPLDQILGMLPGMDGKMLKNVDIDEKKFARTEAIIKSMTRQERSDPAVINGSRRKRISAGSGTSIQEVNKVLKDFEEMKKMFKMMSDMGKRGKKNLGKFKMPF